MTEDTIAIVRACYEAYERNDRSAVEALIAEDFTFSSPYDNGIDRETYFARCWPTARVIASFTFHRLLAQGDEVVATYEAHTRDGRGFRNTEVLTIRDGRIARVEVYFGWSLPHPAPQGGFIDPPSAS